MRSAETALGIIQDRGKSAVLEDTGEPGAPKWRMPGSGRGGWKSAGNGNSLAAYSTVCHERTDSNGGAELRKR